MQVMARAEASGVQATVPFRLAQPTVVPTPTEVPLPTDTPIPTEEPVAPGMPTPTPRPLPTLPPPPAVPAITDWRGDYFNSANLQGQPVLIRNDQQINFDWAMGSPDPAVRMDNFSVRWTRNQGFDAGNYRFLIRADDGARFYVDDQLVIDQWHDGPTTYAVDLSLAQGGHNLRLEYFEHAGWALAQLSWQRVETSYPDWKGEYFNNANLSGTPAFVRNDPWVDFNWGTGSPAPKYSTGQLCGAMDTPSALRRRGLSLLCAGRRRGPAVGGRPAGDRPVARCRGDFLRGRRPPVLCRPQRTIGVLRPGRGRGSAPVVGASEASELSRLEGRVLQQPQAAKQPGHGPQRSGYRLFLGQQGTRRRSPGGRVLGPLDAHDPVRQLGHVRVPRLVWTMASGCG